MSGALLDHDYEPAMDAMGTAMAEDAAAVLLLSDVEEAVENMVIEDEDGVEFGKGVHLKTGFPFLLFCKLC